MALPTPSLFSFFPGEYIKCFAWYLAYHEGLWQHQCTTKAIIFQIWRKCNWKWEGCQRIARCRESKWRSDERAIWQEVQRKNRLSGSTGWNKMANFKQNNYSCWSPLTDYILVFKSGINKVKSALDISNPRWCARSYRISFLVMQVEKKKKSRKSVNLFSSLAWKVTFIKILKLCWR